MRLAFHADSTSVDEFGCGFESGVRHFALMVEDGQVGRMWWHDGVRGEDECLVRIAVAEVGPRVVRLEFAGCGGYTGPYDGVEITYEDYDDRFGDFRDVFLRLLAGAPERLRTLE
ncbi:MAG: hypothetical protein KC933_08805 [Myxococcales bacterium]|nr:hypothetical protein [Myxococcales bacterium]MCB9651898.1 hypothetical protein [Deltaproteobacteria bacterium]